MDYYCDVCDKTIKSQIKYLKSLSHTELDNRIKTKHTIKNPGFFDIDSIFNEYITRHSKKFDLYLVKYDFKLFF